MLASINISVELYVLVDNSVNVKTVRSEQMTHPD